MDWSDTATTRPIDAIAAAAAALVLSACSATPASPAASLAPSQPSSPAPTASPATPTPVPTPVPADQVADRLVTDWNSGSGSAVAADYAEPANLMFIGDDGVVTTYSNPEHIGDEVARRTVDGFAVSRTGDVVELGNFVAFPATWTSDRTFGSGNAVVLLELTGEQLVLGQYLIGVTEEPGSARSAPVELTTRLDEAMEAHNGGDASGIPALFTTDAHARIAYDAGRLGWRDWLVVCDSRAEIESFVKQNDWQLHRTLGVIQQGSLLLYPVDLGSHGFEFWVLRQAADSSQFDYWWDIGGR